MTTGRIQRGYLFGIAWQQTEPDETWFQSTCAYLWAPGADSRGAHVVTTWFVLGTGKTCRTCESFSTMMNEMTHLFQYCQKRVILLLHPNHLPLFSKSLSSVQFSSVQSFSRVQLFETPMDCSMPGFPVHHQLPELAQTQVHPVGDAIQSYHPLSSPSPPAFSLLQHQGLFQWVISSHQVAKVLEL